MVAIFLPNILHLAVVTSLIAAPIPSSQRANSIPGEVVIIDGSKGIEQFPEWYAWELLFHSLGRTHLSEKALLHERLGLSLSELDLLMTERKRFLDNEVELANKLKETRSRLQATGKDEEEIRDATLNVNLEYRFRILEARERLLQQLSPDGYLSLRGWLSKQLAGTTVQLRARAIKEFRLPR